MSADSLDQLKRALAALKELRARLDAVERARTEPIAIIGMGCRFPGADSPAAFWELLENGVDAITETPADRWDVNAFYSPDPTAAGKITTRWGGFIHDVDRFDPYFFGISPREAACMDPQQRLLLEVTWEALLDAGQTKDGLAGSQTGVFIGVHSHSSDYYLMQVGDISKIDTYTGTGTSHSVVSGRLSYLFDWQGPNVTLDTACSSSLVAIHLAVQSLRNKESDLALAGGVNLILSPHFTVAASRMHMLSADGRCKTFDARADGFVRGEGCGVIVLKRLSDALADGDRILALIRGSAINQDGSTNGLTAPNSLSQQAVIRAALANGGLSAPQIGYVEAHGTGTSLGDPIEVEALAAVFGDLQGRPVLLGSAKANIGHLEGAAGVAGVIKAVLSLQRGAVPPLVHFQRLNPHISLDGTPFVIPTQLTPWETSGRPRLAGVSSFGWSGTNAHVILEQAAEVAPDERHETPQTIYLMPLSAHMPEALHEAAAWMRDYLMTSDTAMPDIIYTAALRRSHLEYRLVAAGRSREALASQLDAYVKGEQRPGLSAGRANPDRPAGLVFVFSGQGGQWMGMGHELLMRESVFREAIEACEAAMRPYLDWSLIEQFHASEAESRLDDTDVAQPMLFAVQVALVMLWRAWGIEPNAVVGHSMGEVAAAWAAGVLTLDDAAHVICLRSQLMKRLSGRGATAVVELGVDEASALLKGYENRLSIAVSNSPRSTVISGDPAALDEVMTALQARDIFCRRIRVDIALHSPHMDAVRPELVRGLAGIRPRSAAVPIYSTVTGLVQDGHAFDAEYWGRNLRQPVVFSTVVTRLLSEGFNLFVEIGPHPVLLPAIQSGWPGQDLTLLPSMRRAEDEALVMREALGGLHCAGYRVGWRELCQTGQQVDLPPYPWQRESFWLDDMPGTFASTGVTRRSAVVAAHPLLGWRVERVDAPESLVWEQTLDRQSTPQWYGFRAQGMTVLAVSAFVEMARAAAAAAYGEARYTLADIALPHTLALMDDVPVVVQTVLTPDGATAGFRIYSRTGDGSWTLHASGKVIPGGKATFGAIDVPHGQGTSAEDYEVALAARGVFLDEPFRHVVQFWKDTDSMVCVLRGHTATGLEVAFQLAALAAPESESQGFYAPTFVRAVRLLDPVSAPTSARAHYRDMGESSHGYVDVTLADATGNIVAEVEGIRLQRRGLANDRAADWCYDLHWRPLPQGEPVSTGPSGSWLVLADRSGVGAALEEQLRAMGVACVLVYADEQYGIRDGVYQARPGRADDMRRLLQDALDQEPPACVVHLWSLDLPSMADTTLETFDQAHMLGAGTALALVQTVVGVGGVKPPRLWLATRGAQSPLEGVVPVSIAQASLWGFGRVMAEEHHDLWGGLVDLPRESSPAEAASLLRQTVQFSDGEDQIAFLEGQRYVARLTRPISMDKLPALSFHANGSYLVTGGLGGIALRTVRWMVERGARRLILMGRTALPPRTEWSEVDPNSLAGQRIAAVQELEAMGASVHLAVVDVADETQLRTYLDAFQREGWPPIRGVLHTAAVIEDRLLMQLDDAAFRYVLRPKVNGAWLLHQLLDNLDFFVLYSSVGSILGQAGQGNYAAANAFLDALAAYRRACGLPAISINWGGWAELGLALAAGAERTIQALEQQGIHSFSPEQGIAALENLMQRAAAGVGMPQSAVMPINWARFRQARAAAGHSRLLADLLTDADAGANADSPVKIATDGIRNDLMAAEIDQRPGLLGNYLQRQVANVLKLDPQRVDLAKPFGLMGIDSLMALELRNRLEADLGVPFSATLVWNYPTILEMLPYIASKIGVALAVEESVPETATSELSESAQSLDNALDEVSNLSDEEVLRRLLSSS